MPKASLSRPAAMDGISRRPAVSIASRRRLDNSTATPLRNQSAAPAKSPRRLRRSVAELAKAVVAIEADRPTTVQSTVPARHLPPIDMDLPGEASPLRRIDSLLQHGKLAAFRRWTFRGAIAALVLLIGAGGLLFYNNLNKSFQGGTTTAAALRTNVNPSLLKGEGDGRINVLLMGRGGGSHEAPDLTDTLMLASIDPVNKTSTLISIPRDLWVDVPNQGAMKINAAWETGAFKYLNKVSPGSTDPNAIKAGFSQIDQTVESIFGVTIHYNMLVNFQAFQQAVDKVNGVAVNVPADLVDPTMAWENGNNPVLAKAGPNNFDGKQALNYVRSRQTSSDFARAERQRAIMVALKGKINNLGTLSNPLKLAGLMNTFGGNVQTDLSVKDAARLYSIVKNIPDAKTNSLGLAGAPNNYLTTGTLAGQSITLPTAGLFNYKDIQNFVRTQLKDPYITKENARIAILNGTPTPGLAAAKSEELKTYGYNVISAGNAPNSNWLQTTLVDLSGGKNKYTKRYLEQRLGVTATNKLPDSSIQANGADFVVIIGSNEATPTQN